MSGKNSNLLVKEDPQNCSNNNSFQSATKAQPLNLQTSVSNNNLPTIFLTHEQKIQATYNFKSLFCKKSRIYNIHQNKKKIVSKSHKKKQTKNDEGQNKQKRLTTGHWSQEQNIKYHWFLQLHSRHFIQKHLRRTDKIFKSMQSFIGTREAQQCRSHHQKMQKKHLSFYQTIIKLRMQHYGTCKTEIVRLDMQQNGYVKQENEILIEQKLLESLHNRKQSENNSDINEDNKQEGDEIMRMQAEDVSSAENGNCDQEDGYRQGCLFFADNYEKELSYKLY